MITDNRAVKWSNENTRQMADDIATIFMKMVRYRKEYTAKGLDSIIPNDANEVFADGSDTDGRTSYTGADHHQLLSLIDDLLAMGEGQNTQLPTVLKIAVNIKS